MERDAKTRLGTLVGRFRLVEEIGRGATGTVYRATDTTLERDVAVKLLHAEARLHGASAERFRREARLLSQLEHPNVCELHDVVEDGLDRALVLELVRGRSLRELLKEDLELNQRLELARDISAVLQAAHFQGILHRDVKPGNVMIREDGVVKVLDFGLARQDDDDPVTLTLTHPLGQQTAVEKDDQEHELTTLGEVIGTPAYMSPEQARGEAVTPASDMYSFGLLLEELLTPASSAASTVQGSQEELLEIAREGAQPRNAGLRGDLRRLVDRLRSLDPGDRLTAAQATAALDAARARNGRRARAGLAAAALAGLIGFGVQTTLDLQRQRNAAVVAEASAQATVDFLTDMFETVQAAARPLDDTTVRDLLRAATDDLPSRVPESREARVRIVNALGTALQQLSLLTELRPLLQLVSDVVPEELDDPQAANRLLYLRGWLHLNDGLLEERLDTARRQVALDLPAEEAKSWVVVADTLKRMEQLEEAETAVLRALAEARALDAKSPSEATAETVVDALSVQSQVLDWGGRFDEMHPVLEEARRLAESRFGRSHPVTVDVITMQGVLAMKEDRREDAVEHLGEAYELQRQLLGEEHRDVALAASNYAGRLAAAGRHEEALEVGQRSLATRRKIFGERHMRVAFAMEAVAASLMGLERLDEARGMLEESLEMRRELEGEFAENLKIPYRLLADLHRDKREFGRAEDYLRQQIELAESRMEQGLRSEGRSNALSTLAQLHVRAGQLERAAAFYPEVLDARVEERGADHRQTKRDAERWAELLREQLGDDAGAREIETRFALESADEERP